MNESTHITSDEISSSLAFANKIADDIESKDGLYFMARKLVSAGIEKGLITPPTMRVKQHILEGRKEIVAKIIDEKAAGKTHKQAAAAYGITARTFYKWKADLS
jgi:hypothetical protein